MGVPVVVHGTHLYTRQQTENPAISSQVQEHYKLLWWVKSSNVDFWWFLTGFFLSFFASKHGLYIGSWTCSVSHEPQQPDRVPSSRGSIASEALNVPRWQWEPKQNISGGRSGRLRFSSLCCLMFSRGHWFSTTHILVTLKLNSSSVSAEIRRRIWVANNLY